MQLDADAERRLARIGWRAGPLPDDAPAGAALAWLIRATSPDGPDVAEMLKPETVAAATPGPKSS